MPDWLKNMVQWLDRVESALNADPHDDILRRLGALEAKVATIDIRIENASKTAAL